MTDQSVTKDEGEKGALITLVRRQQAIRAAVKRLSHEGNDPDSVARVIERNLQADGSRDSILEELAQWFHAIRDLKRHGAVQPAFPPSLFISALRKVAQSKDIHPDQLFAHLLEKMIAEADAEDSSQSQPKLATKERILNAALEVFSEKGFHVATVDEIADRAVVGKGTLYRYFANKEILFNELVRLRLEELEKRAEAILDGQDDVLTMISKYLRTYFEFFDRNQRLYRVIVQEHLDVGNQVHDLYVKKVMRRIPTLKRKILEASQTGVLKDVDFQTVFFGCMGFIHGVIQKWLAHECSYSLVEELPVVEEVLFYGFCRKRNAL